MKSSCREAVSGGLAAVVVGGHAGAVCRELIRSGLGLAAVGVLWAHERQLQRLGLCEGRVVPPLVLLGTALAVTAEHVPVAGDD